MRRSLLLSSGSILLVAGLILMESLLLHPLPSPKPPPPPSTAETVQNLLTQLQFTPQESTEDTLLKQLAAGEVPTPTLVLLLENDRSGLVSWLESQDARLYFSALKEALSSSFSPELNDLQDEVQELPGNRTREVLSFSDPALSAERITIVLIGNMLYEFHSSPGKEERISALIEALTMD